MGTRRLQVIIVNYNSTNALIDCLESIYKKACESDIGVWIWDNNSEDNPGRISECFPKVSLFKSDKNIGFAAAVNKVTLQSKSSFVMLLNPDTLLKDMFFPELLSFLDAHPDVGVLGPKIINPDESLQESARLFPTFLTGAFGRTACLTRLFPHNRFSKMNLLSGGIGNGGKPIRVDWVSGACMVVRRKAIDEVGLMDERFFMFWEDADWCRRMLENGWKVVYYPGVSVYHSVGQSSRTRPIRSILEFHKSAYRLYAKYARGYKKLLKPCVFGFLALRFYMLAGNLFFRKR